MQMPESLVGKDDLNILVDMAMNAPPGIFVEVGVYRGGSAYRLYNARGDRDLYLYDTFTGIPEYTRGIDWHNVGEFGEVDFEAIRSLMPEAKIFKGVFPDTLVEPLPAIGFAHIDCDNYNSIKACINRLSPYMADGGIMYFDDYGLLKGATRAVDELLPERTKMRNQKAYYQFGVPA